MQASGTTSAVKGAASAGKAAWPRRLASALRMQVVPKTGVGLDISDDVVSAVQVRRLGRDYKIIRSGSAPILEAGSGDAHAALAAAIKQALKNGRIKTRKVVASLPGDPTESGVRTFPAMPLGELEAVVRREGVELHGEATAWDYTVLSGREGGEQRVLTAFAPGGRVSECLRTLRECGLVASSICVPHLALLLVMGQRAAGDACTAVLHFSRTAVSVTILTADGPVLMRRIKLDQATSGSPGYLVEEINRTVLYFKQQSRGTRVGRVVQCGAPDDVAGLLRSQLGIPVEEFAPVPSHNEKGAQAAPGLAVATGLAVCAARGAEIDLLPEEVKERRTRGFQMVTLLMGAASAVLIYAACYVALGVAQKTYVCALETQRDENQMLVPIRELHADIQAIKAKLAEKEALHAALATKGLPWPHLLWGVTRVLPPEANLTQVNLIRTEDDLGLKWSMRLLGTVSPSGSSRTRALKQLLSNLRTSGIFQAVKLNPVSEESVDKPMGFSIQCEVLFPDGWTS